MGEKRNSLYDCNTKRIFNDLESVVSFILSQMSIRIDSDMRKITDVLEKMRVTNRHIRKLVEDINKDISKNKSSSDKGNQVIEILKRADYVEGKLDNVHEELSMQYLMLQEQLQRKDREASMISNVLKVRHETIKNAIQNVR